MRAELLRFAGAVERDPAIHAWMKEHAGPCKAKGTEPRSAQVRNRLGRLIHAIRKVRRADHQQQLHDLFFRKILAHRVQIRLSQRGRRARHQIRKMNHRFFLLVE